MFSLKEESGPKQPREVSGAGETPSACTPALEQGGCTSGFLFPVKTHNISPNVLRKQCFVEDSGQLFHTLKYHNPPNTKRGISALLLRMVGIKGRRGSLKLRQFKTVLLMYIVS